MMPARVLDMPDPGPAAAAALARPDENPVSALIGLAAAAKTITSQHHRMPSERERLVLRDAVALIIRMGGLHGLDDAPVMGPGEAAKTFRAAMRLALAARVPRELLRSIFNGEEDAGDDAGRKDFQ